ncbi:MAG: short-chain dehydrogenase/reductase [Gemmatimonadetes bacterium]|nr:short-chain dehydrogenase/reductase [Gemmatimonadota bacterium]
MKPLPSVSLQGRTVLVTGASRGIGAAVARRLAFAGARVALLARDKEALGALAREIGRGAVALACDLRDTETLKRAIDQLPSLMGGVPDIVVNNAGAFFLTPAGETSVEAFSETLATNLTAPFAVVRALLDAFRARGSGHVVTIGSIADRTTFAGNAAYAASKHGLRALHEVLREELRGSGVRVSLVSPGPVNTDLWNTVNPDEHPGVTPHASMLTADAVADAVHYVVTAPLALNVDELRLSRS